MICQCPLISCFHAIAFAQQFVPVDRIEIQGVAFAFIPILCLPAAQVPCVVMQRQPINTSAAVLFPS